MEFVDLIQNTFPGLTSEEAKLLHKNFSKYLSQGDPKWMFDSRIPDADNLAQGDILEGLPAVFWDVDKKSGELVTRTRTGGAGVILTNTCDNTRHEYLSFVPLYPAQEYFKASGGSEMDSIKKNMVTTHIFFPATTSYSDLVGDLALTVTITREALLSLIKSKELRGIHALSRQGYYFFLAKLTLHYMRPESDEIHRQ